MVALDAMAEMEMPKWMDHGPVFTAGPGKTFMGLDLGRSGGDETIAVRLWEDPQGRLHTELFSLEEMVAPKWIDRDVSKLRVQEKHAAELDSRMTPMTPEMPGWAKEILVRKERKLTAKIEALEARQFDPLAELRRLEHGELAMWSSPARPDLLARFLIETETREDGRWAGDRITEKGRRALARGTLDI